MSKSGLGFSSPHAGTKKVVATAPDVSTPIRGGAPVGSGKSSGAIKISPWGRTTRGSDEAAAEAIVAYATSVHFAAPIERINIIKQRVPARHAKSIFGFLDLPASEAYDILHLPTATLNRKAKNDERLSPDESERVIGLARLIGQVQATVNESGRPDGFDVSEWVSRWLKEPLAALGGRRPAELMDTMEGQALVSSMIARMQSGAYA